jgi:quinoprotein glucose dehydrogenase
MRLSTFVFAIAILLGLEFPAVGAEEWYRSNTNDQSTKYSAHKQINEKNVHALTSAWTYRSGALIRLLDEGPDTVQVNPIFTGRHLISATLDGRVIALNPATGKSEWERLLPNPVARRGLTFSDETIFVPTGRGVYALRASTGDIDTRFGDKGIFGAGVSFLPPIVTRDMVITANFISSVVAYDINTGKVVWNTSLVKDDVVARLWSGFSFDSTEGLLFLVTSDTSNLAKGKLKSSGYANSVIALDAKSGAVRWQFQEIESDFKDLDMVGPPVLTDLNIGSKKVKALAAVSKTGNVIILDRITGRAILGPKNTPNQSQRAFAFGDAFASTVFNPATDLEGISQDKRRYILHKVRNAAFDKDAAPGFDKDLVVFGLHGGAEWPGAALDAQRQALVIPSNRYPWILRYSRTNNSSTNVADLVRKNAVFAKKCQVCHGERLNGNRQGENEGDLFFPPLIGITEKHNKEYLTSLDRFRQDHAFPIQSTSFTDPRNDPYQLFFRAEKRLFLRWLFLIDRRLDNAKFHAFAIALYRKVAFPLPFDTLLQGVTSEDLADAQKLFEHVDQTIKSTGGYGGEPNNQLLLDPHGFPGARPPWGKLTSIDLQTGKTLWTRPFGVVSDASFEREVEGDRNFGGVAVTAGNLIFANGTTDRFARAFDAGNGKELWRGALPAAGSAPPMTYVYQGCQYVVFTATGGRYVGFNKISDSVVAFKLPECNK